MTYELANGAYQIDTENFETVQDVIDDIREVNKEVQCLCDDCPGCSDRFPDDYPDCLRAEDVRALFRIINELEEYKAAIAAKNAA